MCCVKCIPTGYTLALLGLPREKMYDLRILIFFIYHRVAVWGGCCITPSYARVCTIDTHTMSTTTSASTRSINMLKPRRYARFHEPGYYEYYDRTTWRSYYYNVIQSYSLVLKMYYNVLLNLSLAHCQSSTQTNKPTNYNPCFIL